MLFSRFYRLKTFLLLLILVCMSACQGKQPNVTASDMRQLLFFDNFSRPGDLWVASIGAGGQAGHADGAFRIYVDAPNVNIWATPGLDLVDVSIETETIRVNGDRNNRFGVLCRYGEGPNFYVFLVSSDGYYGIGKIMGSKYRLLGAQTLLLSDQIPKGAQSLHIRAECIQDTLTLFINGQQVHQVRDSELARGDVGLFAGAYDKPGTEVYFDNFAVYAP